MTESNRIVTATTNRYNQWGTRTLSPSSDEPDPHLLGDDSDSEDEDGSVAAADEEEFKDVTELAAAVKICGNVDFRELNEVPVPPPRRRSYQSATSQEGTLTPSTPMSPIPPPRTSSLSLDNSARPVSIKLGNDATHKVRSHSEEIIPLNLPEERKRSSWQDTKSASISEGCNLTSNGVTGPSLHPDRVEPQFDLIDLCDNLPKPTITCTGADKIELLPEENQKQLLNVIRELVQVEKNYVATLGRGIQMYVRAMETQALPNELKGKKYHVFANIERIHSFHESTFLPKLVECNENCFEIARLFYNSISNDCFYGYILFGLNKPRAEKLTIESKDFFDRITMKSDDKLGVNSFLLQPIQILPRYRLLFGQIIKALATFVDFGIKNVKDVVKACCLAEKQVQRLLDTVNDALSLNDIEETYEIDLLNQGKFKKCDIFQMVDTDLNKKFRGKAFLFEYTIVLTEFVDGNETKLQYRTHIDREKITAIDTDNAGGFELVQENFRKTGFSGESRKATEWIRQLRQVDDKGEPREGTPVIRNCDSLTSFSTADRSRTSKFFTSSNFSRSASRYNTAPVKRRDKSRSKSQPRVVSSVSNTSSLSNKSDRSSISSQESYDLGNTTWNDRKYLHSLRYNEKHYLILLQTHKKAYLEDLPPHATFDVQEFLNIFDLIFNYHSESIYPVLRERGMNILLVYDLLASCLMETQFHEYKKYAMLAPGALEDLKMYYENPNNKPGRKLDESERSSLLSLEHFIQLPLLHLAKYEKMLKDLMRVLMEHMEQFKDKWIMDLVHIAGDVEAKFGKFRRAVEENYKIHSKKSYFINVKELGLVKHSELVTMDSSKEPRHKIILMETAVLAVRIRMERNFEEVFEQYVWCLPYEVVKYRRSTKIDERVKFYSKQSKYQKYSVIFSSIEKLRDFLGRLDETLNRLSSFKSFISLDHI